MRDLKADSEQIQNFRSKWRQSTSLEEAWDIGVAWECFCREKAELWAELWLDQALAEKERADKAEALARELVDVLGRVTPRYLEGRLELDLDSVPEATVVRGKWNPIFKGADTCECSVCKEKGVVDSDYGFIATPFCPNCGAKMEVPGDE